jgi:hypothetical protein
MKTTISATCYIVYVKNTGGARNRIAVTQTLPQQHIPLTSLHDNGILKKDQERTTIVGLLPSCLKNTEF